MPWDATVRCFLAASLVAGGQPESAKPLVAKPEDVHGRSGRYWTLHGLLAGPPPEGDARAFFLGLAIDPLSPGGGL